MIKKTPIPQKLKQERIRMTQQLGHAAEHLMEGGPAIQPAHGTNDLNSSNNNLQMKHL